MLLGHGRSRFRAHRNARVRARTQQGAKWRQRCSPRSIRSELVTFKTTGDKKLDHRWSEIGAKGFFHPGARGRTIEGKIDCAVQLLKDLPTESLKVLEVIAQLEREDPATCSSSTEPPVQRGSMNLPADHASGTSSLRRRAQLLGRRPDLEVVELRATCLRV